MFSVKKTQFMDVFYEKNSFLKSNP